MKENKVKLIDSENELKNNYPIQNQYEILEKEKERLLNIFDRIGNELKERPNENIRETYLGYNNEEIKKRKTLKGYPNICKKFWFNFVLFFFSTFYLIGMYLIISIKNSLWDLFKASLLCKIEIGCDEEDFLKKSNYFKYFFDKTLYEPVNFNLIMFWNLIGSAMIKCWGFRKTIILFFCLNSGILIILFNLDFTDFDPDSHKHKWSKISLLFLISSIMSICFGAITLLSQQKIYDYYLILNLKKDENLLENSTEEMDNINSINIEEKDEDKENIIKEDKSTKSKKNKKLKNENKNNSYLIICLTTFWGYIIERLIFFYFSNLRSNNNEKNEENEEKPNYNNNTNITNYTQINHLNNLISNYSLMNEKIIENNELIDFDEDLFFYICLIFIICVILSYFIYQVFLCIFITKEKKEKKEKCCQNCCACCCNWKCVCELCGCILYSESIPLEENTSKGGSKLLCETCQNYCNNAFCTICKCGNDIQCCECCDYNKDDYDKNSQCYFYCYQEKSFCYWLNDFITNDTQKEIIPCMLLYLISKLIIIAYEKEYKDMYESNGFEDIEIMDILISFIVSIFAYAIIVGSFSRIIEKYKNKKKNFHFFFEKLFFNSNEIIIEAFELNLENAGLAFIGSIIKKFGKFDKIGEVQKKNFDFRFLLITILINKYFVFSLNYYCANVVELKKGLEILLSQSTLITIYLNLIDLFIYVIDIIIPDINVLYMIQLVLSGILFLILYIIFIPYFCIFLCKRIKEETIL